MNTVTITAPDPDRMHEIGKALGKQLRAGDLVVLTGPLGAGKTTLTRGIGEGLGVRGPVTSPTFVVARTHPSLVGGAPLIHVDAYRLGSADELEDLDLNFAGSVVIAEWGLGLIEQEAESWLDLRIERPTGGGAASLHAPDSITGAGQHEQADRYQDNNDWDNNDPEDTDEAPTEPRTLSLTGHGPRWAGGVRLL